MTLERERTAADGLVAYLAILLRLEAATAAPEPEAEKLPGLCRTCGWWGHHYHGAPEGYRECLNQEKLGNRTGSGSDGLIHPYIEAGVTSTGPEFGCVHHREEK